MPERGPARRPGGVLNSPAETLIIHAVADRQKLPHLGAVAWALLACPLFGLGVAVDAAQVGWIPVNVGFLALLFGVPAGLALLTAMLSGLSRDVVFSLATAAAAIAGAWLVVVIMLSSAR